MDYTFLDWVPISTLIKISPIQNLYKIQRRKIAISLFQSMKT